jgi:hypothetical protein
MHFCPNDSQEMRLMNMTSRVQIRALSVLGVAAFALGTGFQSSASAASVNGRCAKAGAKSGSLKCTKTKSGLRWTSSVTTTKASAKTAAPTTAANAGVVTTAESPSTTTAITSASTAGKVTYTVKEWAIEGPAQLKAGPVSMSVTNPSTNRHELKIIKGVYAELPKTSNGAVDEEKLATGTIVGKLDAFAGGETKSLSVDLAPGKYLFVCNISFGPASHAERGQILDVTVA